MAEANGPKPLKILTATFRDGVEFNGKKTFSGKEFVMEATQHGVLIVIAGKRILSPWGNLIWMQVE